MTKICHTITMQAEGDVSIITQIRPLRSPYIKSGFQGSERSVARGYSNSHHGYVFPGWLSHQRFHLADFLQGTKLRSKNP